MTDAINYNELMKRAHNAAEEIMEHAESTDDARDMVHDYCEWDWTIYNGKAMELCCNVPAYLFNDAEGTVMDSGMVDATTGLYEHATLIAYWIIHEAIAEQLEGLILKAEDE